jgi:dihydroorotate dehydrogenase (NAD+) catalytic subunit
MPDLSTTIAGIQLKNPVLAASGTFGYGEEFGELIDLNALGGFVVKGLSIDTETSRPWLGNLTGGLSGPAIKPMLEA